MRARTTVGVAVRTGAGSIEHASERAGVAAAHTPKELLEDLVRVGWVEAAATAAVPSASWTR